MGVWLILYMANSVMVCFAVDFVIGSAAIQSMVVVGVFLPLPELLHDDGHVRGNGRRDAMAREEWSGV